MAKSRPFELRQKPPIFGEVKNGITRRADNGNTYPDDLDYWRIVKRVEKNDNYVKLDKVHEKLGEQPLDIPIVLTSDSPRENFAGFRGFFYKGTLKCGAPPNPEEDSKKMMAFRHTPSGNVFPTKEAAERKDGVDLDDLEEEEFPRAMRRFNSDGEDVDPFAYPCHQGCPFWQRKVGKGEKHKFRCELSHTLYFELASKLPYAGRLFVFRCGGINAQKTLIASLKYIREQTMGILAGLPLSLEYRAQPGNTPYGRQHIPHPAIVPRGDMGYDELAEAAEKEIDRRARRYRLMHNRPHEEFEEILTTGTISHMHDRSTLEEMHTSKESYNAAPVKEKADSKSIEIPERIQAAFNQLAYPQRKRDAMVDSVLEKHEETSDAWDALHERLKQEQQQDDPFEEDDIDSETENFFEGV